MNDYICKVATLEEIIKRCDYLIDIHSGNKLWENVKVNTINGYNNGSKIVYVGILNGEIICDVTAYIKEEAFIGDIQNTDNLINEERAYLCGGRADKEYEGQGYFSKLYKFMEQDLKNRGYKELSLGVEPKEVRNVNIYKKWGFTNLIKSVVEYEPINYDSNELVGTVVDFYYKKI
jgi:ribosomal protein S18 acetylase RimI-like enzyme